MFPTLTKSAVLAAVLAVPVAVAVAASPVPRLVGPDMATGGEMAGTDLSLAETWCDARGTVADTLRHDFAEAPTLAALTGTGMTMELWTSDLLGTWTMVHHGGDGISCIVTSGMDWQSGADAVVLMDRALEQTVHPS